VNFEQAWPFGYWRRTMLVLLGAAFLLAPHEAKAAEPVRIVALGDSLTAGYGLPPGAAFPEKLQAALRARGHDVEIQNAGVSGDTASGGLARLDWSVPEGTDAVILELGANDALRGLDPAITRRALFEIVERLRGRGIEVLLAGMLAPPNFGPAYGAAFKAAYDDLAARHDLVFYPFFLEGVAAEPSLNLPDGIHPNAQGIDVVVERILPSVEALIERVRASRASG
jgi:acyl-CoA thioesterase-1